MDFHLQRISRPRWHRRVRIYTICQAGRWAAVISVAHYLWERVPKLRARILKTTPPRLVDLDRGLTGTILVLGVSPLGQSEEGRMLDVDYLYRKRYRVAPARGARW
jgi:hypothetical protein